jgi:hypothetical protein
MQGFVIQFILKVMAPLVYTQVKTLLETEFGGGTTFRARMAECPMYGRIEERVKAHLAANAAANAAADHVSTKSAHAGKGPPPVVAAAGSRAPHPSKRDGQFGREAVGPSGEYGSFTLADSDAEEPPRMKHVKSLGTLSPEAFEHGAFHHGEGGGDLGCFGRQVAAQSSPSSPLTRVKRAQSAVSLRLMVEPPPRASISFEWPVATCGPPITAFHEVTLPPVDDEEDSAIAPAPRLRPRLRPPKRMAVLPSIPSV